MKSAVFTFIPTISIVFAQAQDDSTSFTAKQGTPMVRINTPSSLDNGDYLIWEHNNARNKT